MDVVFYLFILFSDLNRFEGFRIGKITVTRGHTAISLKS